MIIDMHTHLGRKAIIGSAQDLIASMDLAGIDAAMVFAGRMTDQPTKLLLEDIAPYQGRLHAVGSVSPVSLHNDGPVTELYTLKDVDDWLASGAIKGLKFYPGYEPYNPSDKVVRPYLELLEKHGRPAIFHSGDTFCGHHAKLKYAKNCIDLDEVATDHPKLNIVIAHLGYPWQIDAGEVVYKNRNVYVDCSGFVYGKFDEEKEAHFREVVTEYLKIAGTRDRLMFGTDWPISDQSSYVEVARRVFGEDEWVMCKTAKMLFKL